MACAHLNRSSILTRLEQFEASSLSALRAVLLSPDLSSVYVNLGAALILLRRVDRAEKSLQRGLVISPESAEALNNLANVQLALGHLDLARSSLNKAISIDPGLIWAYVHQGLFYTGELMSFDGMRAFNRAITLNPGFPSAHWNKSLLTLLTGDLRAGFMEYEWRWKAPQRNQVRDFERPLWLGDATLEGKSILISTEQGLGDFIQFSRYLPQVAHLAREVIVETHPSLQRLIKSLNGRFRWITLGSPLPKTDYYCPIMSLPLAFQTSLETIPADTPYLSVAPTVSALWQKRLGPKSRPRIGLVWSGGSHYQNDRKRSLSFAQIQPLLDNDAFEYHILQKDLRPIDQKPVMETQNLTFHGDQLNDFMDTAALIEEMDLVISVDTSTAHLAGALRKPLWILIPFSPDFRWLLDRNDSPWYPSAKLYRQQQPGNWDGVVKLLSDDLSKSPPTLSA
jgi:hypothetical protein